MITESEMHEKLDEIEADLLSSPYDPEMIYLSGDLYDALLSRLSNNGWWEWDWDANRKKNLSRLFDVPTTVFYKSDADAQTEVRYQIATNSYHIKYDNSIEYCGTCGVKKFYDQNKGEFYCNDCEHRKLRNNDDFFLKRMLFKS